MGKEKKEIGMEKLIELLCEYLGEEYHWEYFEWYRDIEIPQRLDSLSELKPFIKWLVDNDKIRKDIYRPIPFKIKIEYEDSVRYIEKLEDRILMELSIQDEPIEFLVSVLK